MQNLSPVNEVLDVPTKEVWVNASAPPSNVPELWLDVDAIPARDLLAEVDALRARIDVLEQRLGGT